MNYLIVHLLMKIEKLNMQINMDNIMLFFSFAESTTSKFLDVLRGSFDIQKAYSPAALQDTKSCEGQGLLGSAGLLDTGRTDGIFGIDNLQIENSF